MAVLLLVGRLRHCDGRCDAECGVECALPARCRASSILPATVFVDSRVYVKLENVQSNGQSASLCASRGVLFNDVGSLRMQLPRKSPPPWAQLQPCLHVIRCMW